MHCQCNVTTDYYVVGKRESKSKCIYKPWYEKWNKIKRRRKNMKNTNYKVTAEEQSLAFLLLTIVRWYERITLVCILCAHQPPEHTQARTHARIPNFFCYWYLLSFTTICTTQQLLWCVYFVYLLQSKLIAENGWAGCKNAYITLLLIYEAKCSAHFIWRLKNNKPNALLISSLLFHFIF